MFINLKNFKKSLKKYSKEGPFDHCVIDDFFELEIAKNLEKDFPEYNSDFWFEHNNAIEVKKLSNNWNVFPPTTYQVFSYLNSSKFISILEKNISISTKLYPDIGLNGGGWHIHKPGGRLNTHLDYSVHPKLNLQRKLNIIVYLNSNWETSWKGSLGLWGNESPIKPGKLIKTITPKFNRAVIFDTTQNSWHGLPELVQCPEGECRKSIAIYYLCDLTPSISKRERALFSPNENQKTDHEVLNLIKSRSLIKNPNKVPY
ncbi:2OG-Fe(II) oxygenase [Candidatus Pseudothioglobus sp. Uisw_016]|uniref:2OG-Fe(II) oxygenase n=1 Tax=Candidatus Pseudothioglobus sp. Uisw_016 TaxID=3230995 RepID=UPI003A8AFE01